MEVVTNPLNFDHLNIELIVQSYEQIFDSVRVIDPDFETTLMGTGTDFSGCDLFCAEGIGDKRCKECISYKAAKEQKTFTKLHLDGDKTFLMLATPVILNQKTLILELIKYLSDDFVLEIKNKQESHRFRHILDDFNEMLSKDELTGVFNRRHIDKNLPGEIQKTNSTSPLSIAMVDIDFFKEVNDNYGHSVGDIVIKKFSEMVAKTIRKNEDWVARYGGEEFLICLPGTSSQGAYKVLERIRQNVEKMRIPLGDKDIQITSSFGLLTIDNNQWTPNDIIHNADLNLYEAKKSGRNIIKY